MTNVRPDNGCAPESGLLYVLTVPILLIKYTAIIETPFGDFKNPFPMPEFCWHDHSRFREII